jgi:hypothetical protein
LVHLRSVGRFEIRAILARSTSSKKELLKDLSNTGKFSG